MGKLVCRRGGGTRRREAAGAARGWGMGGAARRKNGPLRGSKRGGGARRQMRCGRPAVRHGANGFRLRKRRLTAQKRPAAGRPCDAANALRTACRVAKGSPVGAAARRGFRQAGSLLRYRTRQGGSGPIAGGPTAAARWRHKNGPGPHNGPGHRSFFVFVHARLRVRNHGRIGALDARFRIAMLLDDQQVGRIGLRGRPAVMLSHGGHLRAYPVRPAAVLCAGAEPPAYRPRSHSSASRPSAYRRISPVCAPVVV